jgi:hypothetical protein
MSITFDGYQNRLLQQIPNLSQFVPYGFEDVFRQLGFGLPLLRIEVLTGAFDGEFLMVEQVLDGQDQLDVATPVEALAGLGSLGTDAGKLAFPKSQDGRGYIGDTADFTDAKV